MSLEPPKPAVVIRQKDGAEVKGHQQDAKNERQL
jgi:hypothetical protein